MKFVLRHIFGFTSKKDFQLHIKTTTLILNIIEMEYIQRNIKTIPMVNSEMQCLI